MTGVVCFPFVGDSVGGSQISAATLIAALPGSGYDPLVVVHREGPMQTFLRQQGIAFESLPLPAFVGTGRGAIAHLAAVVGTAPRLVPFLRRRHVAIVHTQDGRMNQTWGLPARLSGARFVWHQRSMYAPSRLTRTGLRLANKVLCNSAFVLGGLPPEARNRARVIDNPVPAVQEAPDRGRARSTCLEAIGVGAECRLVAFVGNFSRQKRPGDFVAAAARMAERSTLPVRFLLFGRDRDNLRPELESQARRIGILDRLHFMGFQPSIQDWLAGVDVLLAPEVDDAFGRTLIEAMRVGTPVVASATGGHRDILRDGETGLMVPPSGVDEMAAAALKLLLEPALADRIADAALAWISGRFTVESHVAAVTAIYDELLSAS